MQESPKFAEFISYFESEDWLACQSVWCLHEKCSPIGRLKGFGFVGGSTSLVVGAETLKSSDTSTLLSLCVLLTMWALSFLILVLCLLLSAVPPCLDGFLSLWSHKPKQSPLFLQVCSVIASYHRDRKVTNTPQKQELMSAFSYTYILYINIFTHIYIIYVNISSASANWMKPICNYREKEAIYST